MDIKGNNSYSIKTNDSNVNFDVFSGESTSLFLNDFVAENKININVNENASLLLSIVAECDFSNVEININLQKNAQIEVYFAEFSYKGINLNALINLNDNGAKAVWHLASLAGKQDKKNINVSIKHNAPETYGKVDNYGVCKNEAKLLFAGTSHIINGAIKSKTEQNAKIMVFDKTSDAVAKPILKIDENDIEANHAAAVGKISDEHLFYLTSRGISMDEARTLITLGYLKPIFKGFNEEQVEHLDQIIGGRL